MNDARHSTIFGSIRLQEAAPYALRKAVRLSGDFLDLASTYSQLPGGHCVTCCGGAFLLGTLAQLIAAETTARVEDPLSEGAS
jgi:hypothetical protein